jgi:tRNA threonylcarbamoyladenosine biosynthesis protein TsaE
MTTIDLTGEAATASLAERLGALVRAGDVIGLAGPLGAGKTAFVKGLAAGLGVDPRTVVSPTFTLINEHHGGRLPLYHVDLYRLDHVSDLTELGLEELVSGGGVCAIEWLDRFPDVAPTAWLQVGIAITGETSRRLTVRGFAERGQALCESWLGSSRP